MQHPLLSIVLLAMSAFTIARLWFNGSVFVVWREKAKILAESELTLPRLVGELLTCPFCFSSQVTLWLGLIFVLPRPFLSVPILEAIDSIFVILSAMAVVPYQLLEDD